MSSSPREAPPSSSATSIAALDEQPSAVQVKDEIDEDLSEYGISFVEDETELQNKDTPTTSQSVSGDMQSESAPVPGNSSLSSFLPATATSTPSAVPAGGQTPNRVNSSNNSSEIEQRSDLAAIGITFIDKDEAVDVDYSMENGPSLSATPRPQRSARARPIDYAESNSENEEKSRRSTDSNFSVDSAKSSEELRSLRSRTRVISPINNSQRLSIEAYPQAPPTSSNSSNVSLVTDEPVSIPDNFRSVDGADYQYGYDERGHMRQRLIVNEPNTLLMVREYERLYKDYWACLQCKGKKSSYTIAQFDNGTLWVDVNHECQPFSVTIFHQRQAEIASRSRTPASKVKYALRTPIKNCNSRRTTRSSSGSQENKKVSVEPSTHKRKRGRSNLYGDKPVKRPQRKLEESIIEKRVEVAKVAPPEAQSPMEAKAANNQAPVVKPDDIVVAVEVQHVDENPSDTSISTGSPRSVASTADEVMIFGPGAGPLRDMALVFKITDNCRRQAYRFWSHINIDVVTSQSRPATFHQLTGTFPKESGFRCLSMFITGSESYYDVIKVTLKEEFLLNFKTMGYVLNTDFAGATYTTDIVRKSVSGDILTPALLEYTAQLLGCRIGVFENDELQRYGDWTAAKAEENIPTMLMDRQNESYRIVLTLQ